MTGTALHVALTFDNNFWAPAFATMRSVCLFSQHREELVFHLVHRTLSDENRADLLKIAEEFPVQLRWYDLEQSTLFQDLAAKLPKSERLPSVVYARLVLDHLVGPDVERILYLDCDVLVHDDVTHLLRGDMGGKPIAAVRDALSAEIVGGRDIKANRDLFHVGDPYFNSGVVMIDIAKWREIDVLSRLQQAYADGTMQRIYYDQDFLNLTFRNNWHQLPWRWNIIDPKPVHQSLDPGILHYTGERKPWSIRTGLKREVAYTRLYRMVMTNDLFYRFARFRWERKLRLR